MEMYELYFNGALALDEITDVVYCKEITIECADKFMFLDDSSNPVFKFLEGIIVNDSEDGFREGLLEESNQPETEYEKHGF